MNKKLEEYIEKFDKKADFKRDKLLIRFGLFEKNYEHGLNPRCVGSAQKFLYGTEYEKVSFWRRKRRFYKKVPIEISDAEYETLTEKLYKTNRLTKPRVAVSSALPVIGYNIYIIGLFSGIIFSDGLKKAVPLILCWVSALIFGTILVALSKIIDLLDRQ